MMHEGKQSQALRLGLNSRGESAMTISENEYRKLMEMPDNELLVHLREMSAISALADQSVDLIERHMVRIAELERELANATRKNDPGDSNGAV
jgi:hypothetical protein